MPRGLSSMSDRSGGEIPDARSSERRRDERTEELIRRAAQEPDDGDPVARKTLERARRELVQHRDTEGLERLLGPAAGSMMAVASATRSTKPAVRGPTGSTWTRPNGDSERVRP